MKGLSLVLILLSFSSLVFAKEVQLSPKQAHKLMIEEKALVIDVREKSELGTGLVKGAMWFPYSKIRKNDPQWVSFVKGLPEGKTVAFYCARGGRASKVVKALEEKGFDVANTGGFRDWKKAELPIVKNN